MNTPHIRLGPNTAPLGRQFVVTWSIPDNFGGMTGAFLHRSRAFVRLAGSRVDILTFDARPNYPEVEADLRAKGELIDGMNLLNVWDWLREFGLPADASGVAVHHRFTPLEQDPSFHSTYRGDIELTRSRYSADGSIELQVDYYRIDGTLLATDRRDSLRHGVKGGRSIVVCDSSGNPVKSWGSSWGLYAFWMDQLRGTEPCVMFVDSKTAANFMVGYRRPGALVAHVVHSSHLVGTERPIAPIRETRKFVFENLPEFDAVIVLTERQKSDIQVLLGSQDNLYVVPNGRELSSQPPAGTDARPRSRGVVLATLTPRKRLVHAINAVAAASASAGDIRLDIYGEGEEREKLETAIAASPEPVATLHGYNPNARQEFDTASFMLLTSTSEGFPLVLVESMAAGCLPIAYDISYGPADMITDRVNGFLVPPGDQKALAAAIVELQQLDEDTVSAMRASARSASSSFTDEAVTRLWVDVLSKARKQRQTRPSVPVSVRVARRMRRTLALARRLLERR